jgi:hypothetical protein
MSSEPITQKQIAEEISLIPEENRQELYELIRNFRVGLKPDESRANKIMQFAGSWLDISEEDFNSFYEEIEQRRQASSSRRFEF